MRYGFLTYALLMHEHTQWFLKKLKLDIKLSPKQVEWACLAAQRVKNPPAMQETQVQSLGQEDPLEKGTATYSSIFAWRIPWTEEPGRLQSMGLQRVGHDWATNTWTFYNKCDT